MPLFAGLDVRHHHLAVFVDNALFRLSVDDLLS
jgi:hypothetical protein